MPAQLSFLASFPFKQYQKTKASDDSRASHVPILINGPVGLRASLSGIADGGLQGSR
jgi:hypothetical protein